MLSAFNYRNVIIANVAVSSYRVGTGVTHMLRSHSSPLNNDRSSNGLFYLMVTLCFIMFILLMIPSLIDPPVLYIGVIFSLLSIIFVIGFMNSYLKNKNSENNGNNSEVERRLSNDSNNFSNSIICHTNDQQITDPQLSVSSIGSDLPPKYELPPSYSQTTYSINI